MNRLLPLLFLWLISGTLHAQIKWGHQIGTEGTNNLEQHVVDKDGNIISVGYFEGTITLGNFKLTSQESTDMFLYKASATGQVLWAKVLGSAHHGGDAGVATDKDGNLYVAGGFIKELSFEGKVVLQANDRWNAFVGKFDTDGNLLWIKGVLGTEPLAEARVMGVLTANPEGEIVVAVSFWSTVQLEGKVYTSTNGTGSDLILAKFSSSGQLNWAFQPASNGGMYSRDVHLDDAGSVYLTGAYTGTLEMGPHRISSTSESHGDIFLAKLDKSGRPVWLKGFNKTTASELNNTGIGLEVDPATGGIYLTGWFKGSVDFGGIALEGINTSEDPGSADIFIAGLSGNGSVNWAKRIGTDGHDLGWDIKLLPSGGFVLAGAWNFTPFVQQFDAAGNAGERIVLGTGGYASRVTPFGNNGYYLSGQFWGPMNEGIIDWNLRGASNGFLLKIEACSASDLLPAIPTLSYTCTEITVENLSGKDKVKWFRNNVEIQSENLNKLVNPQNGSYKVSVQNACGVTFSDVIIFDNSSDIPDVPILYQVNCKKIAVRNQGQNTITWFKNGQVIPSEREAELTINGDGEYTVQFRNSCGTSTATLRVSAASFPIDYVTYNVITPNGDGKNEYFMLDPALEGSSLQVYNRWGAKVYECSNYQNDWDGQGLPAAVYYWVISNECAGKLKGSVTIIR